MKSITSRWVGRERSFSSNFEIRTKSGNFENSPRYVQLIFRCPGTRTTVRDHTLTHNMINNPHDRGPMVGSTGAAAEEMSPGLDYVRWTFLEICML